MIYQLENLNKTFDDRLQMENDSLPRTTIGNNYNTKLIGKGGVPPYHWKVIKGELPPGVTLNESTGIISGIPENRPIKPIVIELRDESGKPNNFVVKSFLF